MSNDPLNTILCETLGIELPIMAFTHCADVVVAVSEAGGFGVLGMSGLTPEEGAEKLRFIRSRTKKPFGADLLMPAQLPAEGVTAKDFRAQIPQTHIDWINKLKAEFNIPDAKVQPRDTSALTDLSVTRQLFEVIMDGGVNLFAFALGTPAAFLQECKRRGVKTLSLVGNVRQARRVKEAGTDIIVAQGYDAGGHTGRIGTFSLIPQVVDAVAPTPVVAAGGVGDGRGLAAALCLGAVGVWTGSVWMTTHESDTEMVVKQKILEATAEDARITRAYTGKTARYLHNSNPWAQAWERPEAPSPLTMPMQGMLIGEAQRAIRENGMSELQGTFGGQVVGLMKDLKPAKQVVLEMAEQAMNILNPDFAFAD